MPDPLQRAQIADRTYCAQGTDARGLDRVVLSAGRLRLVTDEGTVEIAAPHPRVCKPGTKNAAVALENSVWTNFFVTDETDTDKLVELLAASTRKACSMAASKKLDARSVRSTLSNATSRDGCKRRHFGEMPTDYLQATPKKNPATFSIAGFFYRAW